MIIENFPDTLNPRILSPDENYGAGGEARRLATITRAHADTSILWKNSVYEAARVVAERTSATKVVEIAVGGGQKLEAIFSGFDAELLHVDKVDNRQQSIDIKMPRFFRANLEDGHDTDALRKELISAEATLIILANVIENLDDPRLLLRAIRSTLKKNSNNRLVISTLDRNRFGGKDSTCIPENTAHIRQWTIREFELMLKSSGFRVNEIRLLPENYCDKFNRTIFAEVSCDENFHARFLSKLSLPPASNHLVITTEHAKSLRTGGIGTYYQIVEEYSGQSRIVLYCGGTGLPDEWSKFIRQCGWLHCSDLMGRGEVNLSKIFPIDYQEILNATLLTIFLYDQITLIEFQDYLGIGVHVAQAKRARMLPASVFVMAYAHGNHLYLDHAAGKLSQERDLEIDIRERLSVELADCVIFPSRFLQDLYVKSAGFLPRRHIFQPYPTTLTHAELIETEFRKISTIVFYGKHTEQKGYFDFCNALIEIFQNSAYLSTASQIEKVVVLGSTSPNELLSKLPNVEVTFGVFSRDGAVQKLHELSPHSLVVMPYKGDNHPMSTFEVIGSNSQFIAYRAGGLPDQLAEHLHAQILSEPDYKSLAGAIHRSVGMQFRERFELIKNSRKSTVLMYENYGKSYIELIESFKIFQQVDNLEEGGVSIIVPNYNGTASFLDDVILGLRNSSKKPVDIFFVDDCSTDESFEILTLKASKLTEYNTYVLRNNSNIGLAGTRNVGLAKITTKYVCAHDNDNILLNQFLENATRILDANPDVAVVTCWTMAFNDGDQWQAGSTTTLKFKYRPLGPDIGLGLKENTFGDAMAVYRTEVLQELGGWDHTSKALWEDWQLFLKLTAAGKQIWVIPKEMILYRVRPSSMLRTYPEFNGWLRIAGAIPGIPSNQRFGFLRAVLTSARRFSSKPSELQIEIGFCEPLDIEIDSLVPIKNEAGRLKLLRAEVVRLQAIENSIAWRASGRMRRWLTNNPITRRVLRSAVKRAVHLARRYF